MIMTHVEEAVTSGARQEKACEIMGVDARTLQRWKEQETGEDRRAGPRTTPANRLSQAERREILEVVNSPRYRDLSPKQIVPDLADRGIYIASEPTIYRILREEGQLAHREKAKPPRKLHRPDEQTATAPNQVWSWDITYLRSPVLGSFYYLYMVMDVWSRKIVAWGVFAAENSEYASIMVAEACRREEIRRDDLVLHMDNGSPMKGATLLATLQKLGVVASYSRPQVKDDNPFSESLFRTLKYRPGFPDGPFNSLDAAWEWVEGFVAWYNTEHRHCGIRFVTPQERHEGRDAKILDNRRRVYENARKRRPERWSGKIRNWSPVEIVRLNPASSTSEVALAG
jgi:transposase InsO family protein